MLRGGWVEGGACWGTPEVLDAEWNSSGTVAGGDGADSSLSREQEPAALGRREQMVAVAVAGQAVAVLRFRVELRIAQAPVPSNLIHRYSSSGTLRLAA